MLTLSEFQKLNPTPLASGVVEIISRENPVLNLMPFQSIKGNAYRYSIEDTLPGIEFRGYNESYSESTGVIQNVTENLTLFGGDSDYDTALIAMGVGGNDSRAVHDGLKSKALSLGWLKNFFDGDSGTNAKEFDGLNSRLTGSQVIEAGTDGGELTMDMMDDLVDSVINEPSILLMNKKCRREIIKLARNSSVLTVGKDDFGREVSMYGGVPIAVVEDDAAGNAILGFDEEQGGASNTASIYALRLGADTMHGIQTAPVSVRDLGELDAKPALRTRIEWFSSFVIKHPRAAARLKGVLAS